MKWNKSSFLLLILDYKTQSGILNCNLEVFSLIFLRWFSEVSRWLIKKFAENFSFLSIHFVLCAWFFAGIYEENDWIDKITANKWKSCYFIGFLIKRKRNYSWSYRFDILNSIHTSLKSLKSNHNFNPTFENKPLWKISSKIPISINSYLSPSNTNKNMSTYSFLE